MTSPAVQVGKVISGRKISLYAIGTLTQIDRTMLAAACIEYFAVRHAEEDLERIAVTDGSTHAAVIRTEQATLFKIRWSVLQTALVVRRRV
jgi:hypothetical protein